LLLLDLLDGPDSVVRVNDFLADFEAHHFTSIELQKSDCAARAGLEPVKNCCDANPSVGFRLILTKV
jgi:hypothetical protein